MIMKNFRNNISLFIALLIPVIIIVICLESIIPNILSDNNQSQLPVITINNLPVLNLDKQIGEDSEIIQILLPSLSAVPIAGSSGVIKVDST